jgi:hypothetical protein
MENTPQCSRHRLPFSFKLQIKISLKISIIGVQKLELYSAFKTVNGKFTLHVHAYFHCKLPFISLLNLTNN